MPPCGRRPARLRHRVGHKKRYREKAAGVGIAALVVQRRFHVHPDFAAALRPAVAKGVVLGQISPWLRVDEGVAKAPEMAARMAVVVAGDVVS